MKKTMIPMVEDPSSRRVPGNASFERFLATGDQQAFAELVAGYLPLVYGTARRITQAAHLAEEVVQNVFIRLAASRCPLPAGLTLETWLHRTTRSLAIDLVRAETRRRRRESTAAAILQEDARTNEGFPWERLSPLIDEIVAQLPAADRELILSRFFTGSSQAAMARSLGLSEDALRMRLKRAVERLRSLMERRGIGTSATFLALCLPSNAAAVPTGVEEKVLRGVMAVRYRRGWWLVIHGAVAGLSRRLILASVAGGCAAALVLIAVRLPELRQVAESSGVHPAAPVCPDAAVQPQPDDERATASQGAVPPPRDPDAAPPIWVPAVSSRRIEVVLPGATPQRRDRLSC